MILVCMRPCSSAYNHNLDTSPEFYPKVTSSRNYEDRLNTIAAVRDAGISVCCGGILGGACKRCIQL